MRPRQDLITDLGMHLHHVPLLGRQGPRLQQNSVRNSNLSDVVHDARELKLLTIVVVIPESSRQELAVPTHPLNVFGRVVISELGRDRELFDRLRARQLQLFLCELEIVDGSPQLFCALLDLLFEELAAGLDLEMERPRLQKVLDSKEDFHLVEGLGYEVLGSEQEGPLPALRGDVGSQHEYRQECMRMGEPPPHLLEHAEPVQLRHVEIQKQ